MDLALFVVFLLRSSADYVFDALRIEVGGLNLTAGAFLNVGLLALASLMLLSRKRPPSLVAVWLPFLGIAAGSILWAPEKGEGLRALLVLSTYFAVFAIPFMVNKHTHGKGTLLKALIYSSIAPSIFGFLEFFFFPDASGRIKSLFLHPNVFAFYLTFVSGIIFFLLESSTVSFRPAVRKFMYLHLGVLGALLVLTQTRAAWVGLFIVFGVHAVFVNRRYLLILLVAPLLLFVPAVSDRLTDLEQGTEYRGGFKSQSDSINSFAWRKVMWESALDDLSGSFVLGKGLASFGTNSLTFFPIVDPTHRYGSKGVGAHNVYIQILYETGVVGLICYLAIFAKLLSLALEYRRYDRRGAVTIASVILGYMVESFSDNMFEYGSVNLYFWGGVGVIFSYWARQRSNASIEGGSARTMQAKISGSSQILGGSPA
ncbi:MULTISPECIES: O-antigen ligase family protein [unclassified Bradyrhizobium]|uniref:O-antigen ligase family protein n=1 Tax=unclassified Bradyrhizobium TaxID=2631580 RepID=UPI001CD1FF5D|nr:MULTISPECIES: O-antigen ligase family protein [unclassified Bradyrhizobium]MCA1495220.1 O-antigen ligase family protein [Bradyrhizobium sp. NBAIM14]MCA1531028.1 O-antigen ligase family protein [Bradyrhizobium sp. NBAIM03]